MENAKGLLDQAGAETAPSARPGPAGESALQRIKQTVEQLVPPPLRKDYESIVKAGMKLMWADATHRYMQDYLNGIQPQEVPQKVAHGIAKTISIIVKEVGVKPDLNEPFYPASFLAAQYLMCDALVYIQQQNGIEVERLIDATTQATQQAMLKMYGIDEEKARLAFAHAQQQQAGQPNGQPTGQPGAGPQPQQGVR